MAQMAFPPSPEGLALKTRGGIVALITVMGVIELLSGASQGYINPLLPQLSTVFGISDTTVSGMFVVSTLAFAVFTPVISRMGDVYGNRLMLRVTTGLVTIAVLVMAVIPTLGTIFVGVAMLAIVVGFIPMMTGILRYYSPEHTRLGVSVMVASLFLSLGVGALTAGWVGGTNPLRGFWVAAPFAIVALVGTFLLPLGGAATRQRLPWIIVLSCSLGLVGIVTAMSMGSKWGWVSTPTLLVGTGGVMFLAVWIWHDSRARAPFVPLKMFRVPQLRVVSAVTVLLGFTSGYLGANSIFLRSSAAGAGYGFEFSAGSIALVFFGITILGFLSSIATAPLLSRLPERYVLALGSLLTAGFFVLLLVGWSSLTVALIAVALLGLSRGVFEASTRALCVESVPKNETATASGINELALSIGVALGAATVTMIVSASTTGKFISLDGFHSVWIVMLIVALASALVALFYRRSALDPITGLIRTVVPRSGHTARTPQSTDGHRL